MKPFFSEISQSLDESIEPLEQAIDMLERFAKDSSERGAAVAAARLRAAVTDIRRVDAAQWLQKAVNEELDYLDECEAMADGNSL